MNHSPAEIIAQYLISKGKVIQPGESGTWPIYVGYLPDAPESRVDPDVVASMDSESLKDGRVMGGDPLFHRGVQILLRGKDYNEGYVKAEDLANTLASARRSRVRIGDDAYRIDNVTQTTDVVRLGLEEGTKRRWTFSVNFLATLQEV